MTISSIHIDPSPGAYPNCVCDGECEFPCWQQVGINPDFDPSDKDGCCCCRRRPDAKPATKADIEEECKVLNDWLIERGYVRGSAAD